MAKSYKEINQDQRQIGPAIIYGTQALAAVEELSAE